MATIQDLISQYENKNIANRRGGLGSPQLSPELLKALKVPENKGLGSFFPAGVPGASGTDYYTFYRDGAADSFNTIIGTSLRSKSAMLRADDAHISGTAGQAGSYTEIFVRFDTPPQLKYYSIKLSTSLRKCL